MPTERRNHFDAGRGEPSIGMAATNPKMSPAPSLMRRAHAGSAVEARERPTLGRALFATCLCNQ